MVVTREALAGRRALLVDLFGHGYSDTPENFGYTLEDHAQTTVSPLEALGIDSCLLFGHSMGGAVAITLAVARPDLVLRLVLTESNLDPGGGFLSKGVAAQSERRFAETGQQEVVRWALEMGMTSPVATFRATSPLGFQRSAVGLVRGTVPTMRESLYGLGIPRAYIFGELSLPDPNFEELRSHGIEVSSVAAAGHDMAFDNPDGLAERIAESIRD